MINEAAAKMEEAMKYLQLEYSKLQTGRANTALVDGIMVESYGTMMPLKGVANISIPEANQIAIQPWSRDQITNIEKAITAANLGLNPQNNGTVIRLILPPLTGERRKELVKLVHKYAENARVSVRNARHESLTRLKNLEKEKEIGEDELKRREDGLQHMVDDFNKKIEECAEKKEQDVMTV
jgi:ribosome recycling factor